METFMGLIKDGISVELKDHNLPSGDKGIMLHFRNDDAQYIKTMNKLDLVMMGEFDMARFENLICLAVRAEFNKVGGGEVSGNK